ncbi:MAG: SAM-dependent methyltransferase [Sphingobacteriales bacterium 39-19]|nr:methyltransferase domain-containing protein [Sphingobacteriales bacterium]OJW07688.1 MAG: SAM-dependent methyltransferase [Sphingobacteriales bacterium 39-19]
MSNKIIDSAQGHWLLAKMGKRVLRPGGKDLTLKMINGLHISPQDRVIEFAPGIGYTAEKVLALQPQSYTGIELNEEAASLLRKKIQGASQKIIVGNASHVPLGDACCDKIYGEAMLTMNADHRKSEIIKEAHRLLRKGGLYGIHELGLTPDNLSAKEKANIQHELALCIKVNARPLTQSEWVHLLEQEGFRVIDIKTNPMLLLETRRIIDDEGVFRSLKIGFNILRHPAARKRIREMKCVFTKYRHQMNALSVIAEKI